jgi:hypothetical protein
MHRRWLLVFPPTPLARLFYLTATGSVMWDSLLYCRCVDAYHWNLPRAADPELIFVLKPRCHSSVQALAENPRVTALSSAYRPLVLSAQPVRFDILRQLQWHNWSMCGGSQTFRREEQQVQGDTRRVTCGAYSNHRAATSRTQLMGQRLLMMIQSMTMTALIMKTTVDSY